MSQSLPPTDTSEAILAQFVLDLEKAADQQAVVRCYQDAYPFLADEFAAIAEMPQYIDPVRRPSVEELPPYLGGFRLDRQIGKGGMGEVWLAEEERLRRRVAVKIIRRQCISDEHRRRFLREQEVLAHLHQTHIVPIFAAGEVGTIQYFAMPYVEGAALNHAVDVAREQQTSSPSSKTPALSALAEKYLTGSTPEAPATVPGASVRAAPTRNRSAPARPTLSPAYYCSVARVMANVAEGLQHAHDKGIIHRDVKPSNIMVEKDEKCWIIDFGLAGYLSKPSADGSSRKAADLSLDPILVSGVMGTAPYMAPEQWTDPAQVDARTDVWGLGVTLYELLTLEPAFKGNGDGNAAVRTKILSREPAPLRRRIRGLPADLTAICLKALQKKPEQRYQTAREFADDLRRWLRSEPVRVARMQWLRQAGWWVLQNKGLAAILMAVVLTVVGLLVAWGAVEKANANAAQVRADAEEARADTSRREVLLLQLQQTRLAIRNIGWSKQILHGAGEAGKIRVDDDLRKQAAAALAGLDARIENHLRHGASAVAWDREGKRLLMGAVKDGTASLWESERDEEIPFEHGGQGPVAFRTDGTPVQLVANLKDRWSVGLWDVAKGREIRSFQVPPGGEAEPATALNPVLLAMADDGAFVAAATTEVDKQGNPVKGHLAAWEAGTGNVLVKAEAKATALALSPNGALLAAAEEDGRIRLWSLAEGKELAPLHSGRTTVYGLAFGRNPHRPAAGQDDATTLAWLLAGGEEGGAVTVWDLRTRQVNSRCQGSGWDVHAVAFSPDGMTLASGGHGPGGLWDVATGRLLLAGWSPDQATAVAFSPDGHRLAVSSDHPVPGNSNVKVYELDLGRGMQALRGLVGAIAHVRFSPDGRWVAALSHNWQVALWDSKENRLLHVFDVPKGLFADNADLCFSPDGSRFAFVTWQQAEMWDVESARELGTWKLPPGLVEMLAFRSKDELVLFRMETVDGLPPVGEVSWREHPRVCRIRRLAGPKQIKLLAEIKEFNTHVFDAVISPDGSYIVAEGLGGSEGDHRSVRIYDGATGKEVGTLPMRTPASHTQQPGSLRLDATGQILAYRQLKIDDPATLVEIPSGKVKGLLDHSPESLGPGAKYWVGSLPAHQPGTTLVRRQDGKALLTVDIDSSGSCCGPFSADGTRWAWGHTDGSVTVCDIPAVQRRLAEIGLGW